VNTKRLEAVPWARYCIDCQEKMEKGQLEEAH
jgi:DnaK suppressor protein